MGSGRVEGGAELSGQEGASFPWGFGVDTSAFPVGCSRVTCGISGRGVGRGWSTDSGPESPGVSPGPALGPLCDPGQAAPLLGTPASTVFKTDASPAAQVFAKSTPAIAKVETPVFDTCL